MNKIIKQASINALGTVTCITTVVSFIFFLRNFPRLENTIIIPIAMLMLLVCSAAITGFLVFGKPAMLYLDGKKKEAISLLTSTIVILFLCTLTVFIFLIFSSF